jgi:spore coat polysaccharide biosynthesis protein SpsF (cytidylyltransferase family)
MKIFYTISGHNQIEELKFHLSYLNDFTFIDKVFLSCANLKMVEVFKEHYKKNNYEILLNEDYGYKIGCVVNVFAPLQKIKEEYKDKDYFVIEMEADAFFTEEKVLKRVIEKMQEENKDYVNIEFSMSNFDIDYKLQTVNIFSKKAIEEILDYEINEAAATWQWWGMEDYFRYSINKKHDLDTYEKQKAFHDKHVLELRYDYEYAGYPEVYPREDVPKREKFVPSRYITTSYINMPNYPGAVEDTIAFINKYKDQNEWDKL